MDDHGLPRPANQADGIYQPELEMAVGPNGEAAFTFVLERKS